MAPGPSQTAKATRQKGTFEDALARAELDLLRNRAQDPPKSTDRWEFGDGLAGLAFSGGGIRSASFNLGFLQALLRCRLFRRFHYLSTVSGGGYLGSMVSGHARVAPPGADDKAGFPYVPESPQIDLELLRHVREHCSYLTPSNGRPLADLLAFGVVLLRGLVAHILMAVLFLGVLAVPYLIRGPEGFPRIGDLAPRLPFAIGVTAGVIVVLSLLTLFWEPLFKGRLRGFLNAPLAAGICLLLLELAALGHSLLASLGWEDLQHWVAGGLGAAGAGGAYGALRGAVGAFEGWARWRKILLRVAPYLILLGAGYFLLWVFRTGLFRLVAGPVPGNPAARQAWIETVIWTFESVRWWTQIALLVLVSAHAVFLFATGSRSPERAAGRRLQIGLYAIALAVVTVPVVFPHAGENVVAWTGLGCLVAGLARSVLLDARKREPRLAGLSLFILILALVTLGRSVAWACTHAHPYGPDHAYWHLFLLLVQAGAIFCLFFNLNATSLHSFYRDRLADLFLFDPRRKARLPDADLSLAKLADNAREGFPFHIVSCAVNLPASEDRRVAERRVDSFLVTGTHVGSHGLGPDGLATPGAYRRAGEPIDLPAALAVSGAALSSHFGAGVPAPVSALMTILNVRLGLWWANPRYLHGTGLPSLLAFTIWPVYFVKELFSAFDPESLRCLVSDGGHFDNLGLYELVRRRCRYVVVSDAGADPQRKFEDLGSAIRRCRVDHGVEIELETASLRTDPATGLSERHVAMGTIRYPEGGRGILIYVKSSMTGDEPPDLLQYRCDHPLFPHESTADQDFDEAQFESYRRLGEHVGEETFGTEPAGEDLGDFFAGVRDRWRAPATDGGARFIELCGDFMELERDEILQSPNLLDHEQYPELFGAEPPPVAGVHREFHHAVRQIQLMENFWLAFRLDDAGNRQHPDNRGAMNLFRRWARSEFLRSVYPVVRSVYGQEFQKFCEDQLRLPTNADALRAPAPVPFTAAAWAACEDIVAHHPILDVVRGAAPSLLGRASLHRVDLVHRGGATPVACATSANGESRPGEPDREELFAFMIDNRYFYSGVAERMLRAIVGAKPATEFVMLPVVRGDAPDLGEWEGRVRYFQQLGFVAGESSWKREGEAGAAGYVARAWRRSPRAVAWSVVRLPYLRLAPRSS